MTDDFATQAVLARLGWGRDRADSISAIAEELGCTRRQVEQAVQALRLAGHPVCSGPEGIWLGDDVDLEQTIRSLRGRLVNQYQTVLAMRRTLRRMRARDFIQATLFEDAA